MSDISPTRSQNDLADMVEMLLDKGIVINADIAVNVGETELLGIRIRAAVASFETAAQYGLEFPEGTDMRRVEEAASRAGGRLDDVEADGDGDDEGGDSTARSAVEGVAAPVGGRSPSNAGVPSRPSPDDPREESDEDDPGDARGDPDGGDVGSGDERDAASTGGDEGKNDDGGSDAEDDGIGAEDTGSDDGTPEGGDRNGADGDGGNAGDDA